MEEDVKRVDGLGELRERWRDSKEGGGSSRKGKTVKEGYQSVRSISRVVYWKR